MKIKSTFVKRKIGDKYLVVSTGPQPANMFIELNETSSDIWDGIEKGCSVEEIVDSLCDQYAVSRDKARQDVEKLIAAMRAEGIFED